MSLCQLLWFCVSDLRHRWLTAALNVAAVGISVMYVLVLGFYAVNTHQYQQRVVEEAGPAEKVVVTVPNAANAEQWFTDDRIGEFARMTGIRGAFPCVELNVDVSLEGQRSVWLPLESTAPGDPTTGQARMAWGRQVGGLAQDEVILGKRLFEKLGGSLTPQGPSPQVLTVCLKRTRGGKEEVHRHTLHIVGLLKHQPSDRIYLPAKCAAALDRWVTHRLNSLEGDRSPTDGLCFPFCYAYVPEAEEERVAGESERLGLTAERKGIVEICDPDLPVRRLVRYEIRTSQEPPEPLDDRLLTLLRMAQPTFAAVRPYLAFEGRIAGRDEAGTVVASDAADPARFAVDVSEGEWLDERNGLEVVLPGRCAPGLRAGTQIDLVIERPGVAGSAERLTLPLHVAGVAESSEAVIPLPLAARIARWQQGELQYDSATQEFRPPAPVAARDGYVRCTLIADGFSSVPALVAWLQVRGFRTVDQVDAYEGMLRLAQVLALLVGLAVLGSVLNGAITVLVSTLMSVRSKTFEIGILRAHGFRDGEVLLIFLFQAVLVGLLAMAFAAAVVFLVEPVIRSLVCNATGIRATAFVAASPFSRSVVWLFVVAALVAVVFSVAGVIIPAAWACRLSPVEALRRRE